MHDDTEKRLYRALSRLSAERKKVLLPLVEMLALDEEAREVVSNLEGQTRMEMFRALDQPHSSPSPSAPQSPLRARVRRMLGEPVDFSVEEDSAYAATWKAAISPQPARKGVPIQPRPGIHALLKLGMTRGSSGPIPFSETLDCLESFRSGRRPVPLCLGTNSQAVSEKFRPMIKRLYILADDRIPLAVDISETFDQWEFERFRMGGEIEVCPRGMEEARTWFLVEKVWRVLDAPTPADIRLLKTGKPIATAVASGQATFFYVLPLEITVLPD